jgi:AcrR family transcriptional regulator
MTDAWLRHDEAELAADEILDAAGRTFVTRGISRTGMSDIAKAAGCSRGTLYRYFKTRQELHLAFVNRSALRLAARLEVELADVREPRERLTLYILRSLHEVRSTPELAAWFAPEDSGAAAAISRASDVVQLVARTFVDHTMSRAGAQSAEPLRARWLVRAIVSLLTMPAESLDEEREMVERFVVPAVFGDRPRLS